MCIQQWSLVFLWGSLLNVDDLHVFLLVTTAGSLSQAAKRLEISPMTASRRLANLEGEMGTRLLHRTTRSISLTPEGEEFLPYARAIVQAEAGAKSLFATGSAGASGLLRVTAPSGLGRRDILPLIPVLLNEHPRLRVELSFHETQIDIVGQGIDVAIRVAPLRDSNLIAKKIVENPRVLCASPAYIRQFGCPKSLAQLVGHHCLRLSNVSQWTFIVDDHPTNLTVEGRFSCNNVESIRELCVGGLGIAQLTQIDVADEVRTGQLVEIELSDARPQELGVWALLPTKKYMPDRVSVFIEYLRAKMGLHVAD